MRAARSRSLSFKLILACEALLLLGGGLSWFALIRSERADLMRDAVSAAAASSELVRKGVRFDMLTVDREDIQRTVEDVAAARHIRRIRIFDARGRVFFSSQREEIGRQVERGSFACRGCHADPERPAETLTDGRQWITYRGPDGYRVLTFVDPIYHEPSCAGPTCHPPAERQRVLGILETDFSLRAGDASIREKTRRLTLYAVLLLAASSVLLYAILRRIVLGPVESLAAAMGRVAEGDLDRSVPVSSADEMGRLARSFNDMTAELKAAREQVRHWTQSLEKEIAKKSEELRRSQDKLVRAEKLAALGRLTAEVAHEIRNPLTAIGGFARRLSRIAAAGKEKEYAEVIVTETDRLETILRDVLTFSRDARFHIEPHPIDQVILEVLGLHEDLCAEQNIAVEVRVEEGLPRPLIDREQVRQALNNLLSNAIDAMPGGGTLRVSAGSEVVHGVRFLRVAVADTGQGIPPQDLELIFEPFFSTKGIGHGTGLGLSITRKIIEEHGGFVRADSALQQGSTFSLYFPLPGPQEAGGQKCWEFMKCGRDKDATTKCPAYPHFGRVCWVVAGTFCEGKAQGTFAQKYADCTRCDFFRTLAKEREGQGAAG